MKYHSRSTRLQDLAACELIITDRFAYDRQELSSLHTMWRDIIEHECGVSRVVCDSESGRILAFGLSAFVSNADADGIRESGDLVVGRNILQAWSRGQRIFLNEQEIAAANSTQGLNCVVTHHGYANLAQPDRDELWPALAEAFFFAHKGLLLRSFLHKVITSGWMLPFLRHGLLRVDCEYSDLEAQTAGVPPDCRPVVCMYLTAEHAKAAPGNFILSELFLSPVQPKTNLHRAERQLLRLALEGHTDKALADLLDAPLSTIKKRWRIIHAAMRAHIPHISPVETLATREGIRGNEERRHVLTYLRDHPEELFPHVAT